MSAAAIFLNVDYPAKHVLVSPAAETDPSPLAHVLEGLRTHLGTQQTPALLTYAYANLKQVRSHTLAQLYRLGATAKHQPHGSDKGTPVTQLGLDVLELAYTRPAITTFVFVGAERNYLPLLHHLRSQGRQVLLAGVPEATADELLASLGKESFLDVSPWLPALPEPALPVAPQPQQMSVELVATVYPPPREEPASVVHISLPEATAKPVDPRPYPAMLRDFERELDPAPAPDPKEDEHNVLLFLITELYSLRQRPNGQKVELWMSPVMKKIANKYPSLGNYRLNDIIKMYEATGVLRIEKRSGTPHDFSVIILDETHVEVLAIYNRQAA
jgi:hypothetical protein